MKRNYSDSTAKMEIRALSVTNTSGEANSVGEAHVLG